jgi:hypothetical protein
MNYHKIAEERSAANPGELIYVWTFAEFGDRCGAAQYAETLVVANEAELQFNSVRDSQIVAVYRDGEKID